MTRTIKLILEFGKADLGVVMSDSDNFTIAYEIELEETKQDKDKYGFDKTTEDRYEQMYAALESGEYSEEDIEDMYNFDFDDAEMGGHDEWSNDSDDYSLGNEPDMNRGDDYFPFTEDEIHLEFPNFFKKWGNEVFIKPDITLDNGLEIIPQTYLSSVKEAFDFVDDFFTDFYQQDRFELNDNTGWHINIGFAGENLANSNLFKGAVLLSDEFATKEFAERLKSQYAKPIRDYVMKSVKDRYDYEVDGESLMKQVFSNNLESLEKVGNEFLLTTGTTTKEFGFNPRGKYVEFRYPGGKLTPMQIKEATLYYCYLIKAIVDPSFKRKEYIKKLYKLLFGGDNQ